MPELSTTENLEVMLLEYFEDNLIPLEIECFKYFSNGELTWDEAIERINDYIYDWKLYAFLLYCDDNCLSYAVFQKRNQGKIKSLFTYTKEGFRGNGYGSFLRKKAHEELAKMGNKIVFGEITKKNLHSKKMIENCGGKVDDFYEDLPSYFEVSLL